MPTNYVIDPKLKVLLDNMPEPWGCKDNNSIFSYANEKYTRLIGLEKNEDIVGMTDYDIPCDAVICADLFREQDKQVIKSARPMQILDIHPFADHEWRAYIFTKMPLKDDFGNIMGTIFNGRDITNKSSIELGSLLSRLSIKHINSGICYLHSYLLNNNFENIKLTDRESECLFYLLRGKTVKKIGLLLGLSHRTIEEYCDQLKLKFNAQNKHELIDKAIENGYLNTIPGKLFNQQLSVALNEN